MRVPELRAEATCVYAQKPRIPLTQIKLLKKFSGFFYKYLLNILCLDN